MEELKNQLLELEPHNWAEVRNKFVQKNHETRVENKCYYKNESMEVWHQNLKHLNIGRKNWKNNYLN